MSIYNTSYQACNRTPDYSPPLPDSKRKGPSILHVNTNPSINERIHLVKKRTPLKGLQISSTPNTKPLSKRVSSHLPSRCSSSILISKSSEIAKNYGQLPKASNLFKKETRISNALATIEPPEELEKRRNWEICQAKLKERTPAAIAFSPTLQKNTENQRKLTQRQIDRNQQILNSIDGIDLSNSKLTFFPPDFFYLLPNLESLYLDGNNLRTISFKLNRANYLTELNISKTQINELPDEIRFFTKLKILDVSHNDLSSIPEWVYSLKNLEELNISKNQIQVLSPSIGELTKLEILFICSNKLKEIPSEINNLGCKLLRLCANFSEKYSSMNWVF